MPNRYTRNTSNTLVPKVGGTKPDGTIVDSKLADLTVTGAKIADTTITGAKLVNLTVTEGKLANASVQGRTVDFFKSAVTTGTGSNLNIAHGLGRTPTFVFVVPQTSSATGVSVIEGTHTGTDCVVNAPTTTTFVVIAF